MDALTSSSVMVVIITSESNASKHVMREAERESMGAIEKAGLIPDFRLAPKSLAE